MSKPTRRRPGASVRDILPEPLFDPEPSPVSDGSGGDDDIAVLLVVGDDMQPAYGDGDLVYFYAPTRDLVVIRERLLGRECVVRLADGGEFVRRIEEGRAPDRFTLTGCNTPTLEDVRLLSAAPVIWIRKAGV